MNTPNKNSSDQQTRQQYLSGLQALCDEMSVAISAIEHNDGDRLQRSVATQETICTELARTRACMTQNEVAVWPEVRSANGNLAKVNRFYAALLKRSMRSATLLAALYRNHKQGYGQSPGSQGENHTWSCEG